MRGRRYLVFLASMALLGGGAWFAAAGAGAAVETPAAEVPPPPGTVPSSVAVTPFETVSSPYLKTTSRSYIAPLTPQELYLYYLPRLRRVGYRLQGYSTSGDRSGTQSWDWSFTRGTGMNDTVLLTVERDGKKSVYSLARELIVAPARAKASIVPAELEEVTVRARQSASSPWATRTLRSPDAWRHLLAVANALPVDARGAHGCLADFGAAATVRFIAKTGSWTFTVDPACGSVLGPAGSHLMDQGLWAGVSTLMGFPAQMAP